MKIDQINAQKFKVSSDLIKRLNSYSKIDANLNELKNLLSNVNEIYIEEEYKNIIKHLYQLQNITIDKESITKILKENDKSSDPLSRFIVKFAKENNQFNLISNQFKSIDKGWSKNLSDELYLMSCIRADILDMNWPGAVAACKLQGQPFEKNSDSAVLSKNSFMTRLSSLNRENGNDIIKLSENIVNSKEEVKLENIAYMFAIYSLDKNFDHVIDKNKSANLLKYFEDENNKTIEAVKQEIEKSVEYLKENYRKKFSKELSLEQDQHVSALEAKMSLNVGRFK